MNEQHQIEATIAFLESRRSTLSDSVVDAAIEPLRQELNTHIINSRERRKQVTVLFADISNFTSMSENMDAEDVRNIVESLWRCIDKAIIDHGGTIDKHIGDAVMAIWGIQQTREDDPERAVRAALAMQRAVRNWRTDMQETLPEIAEMNPPISIRIGINTGTAILGLVGTTREFTAIGDTVNTASRVETAAPLGNILISHSTYLHVRGLFELRERDPIFVKGKSKKLATYLVQRARPQKFQLEQQEVEGIVTPMIGRASDFIFLQEHFFEAILENRPQLITIVGEAGVGKTRLIYEFNSWMESQSWRTSYFKGRARQGQTVIPYSLLRDLILQRFDVHDSDNPSIVQNKLELGFFNEWEPESDIQERTHLIAHLVGCPLANSRFVTGTTAADEEWQTRARNYLIEFFKAVSFTEPTVFLIEDVHWADRESLALLEETVAASHEQIMMVVCTARPSFVESHPHWAVNNGCYSHYRLTPLTKAESRELIDEILCKAIDVPELLYDIIISRAEGIPYHIEEFIKMLVSDQVILKGDENWVIRPELLADVNVPTTLTSILEARLDNIPRTDLAVLQCAAVIGHTFWWEAIEFMLSKSEGSQISLAESLRFLEQRHLIEQTEFSQFKNVKQFSFTNILLQQVCYERILKRDRRKYHELFAEWMTQSPAVEIERVTDMIVNHFIEANCCEKALIYLAREGRQALIDREYEKALSIFDKTLAISQRGDDEWHQKFVYLRQQALQHLNNAATLLDLDPIEAIVQDINDTIESGSSTIGYSV